MLSSQFSNIRKALEKQWVLTNKGFKAWRAELQDQTQLIREMKHDIYMLKSQLYDKKAVESNLPHRDLNSLIPFKSDEDLITCLSNTDLNNALFSKVSSHIIYYSLYIVRPHILSSILSRPSSSRSTSPCTSTPWWTSSSRRTT